MSLPLHPAIVHLPIGGALLGLPLALAILVMVVRGAPRRTWILAALVQGLSFGGALLALNSGEEMEERVEDEVPEAQIEAHEAHAQRFAAGLGLSAALMLAAAFAPRNLSRTADVAAVAAAGLALGLAVPTGHTGGTMVYGDAEVAQQTP
ncbi:hypothetical protein LBMAG42_29480 [Deltaproteobacteria bacterium]|nr:hypothetical protein LBMAG42_29480 [Deltaproteobacteria bacterium]